jgi:hypothetical protein
VSTNINNLKNKVVANVANTKGYKRLYQAKLLIRSGIQADGLPLSRSNLASYALEYLWSVEVLLLLGG